MGALIHFACNDGEHACRWFNDYWSSWITDIQYTNITGSYTVVVYTLNEDYMIGGVESAIDIYMRKINPKVPKRNLPSPSKQTSINSILKRLRQKHTRYID